MGDKVTVHLSTKADEVARFQKILAKYNPDYKYQRLGVAGRNCTTTAVLQLNGEQLKQLILDWHNVCEIDVNIVGEEAVIFIELDDILRDSLSEAFKEFFNR